MRAPAGAARVDVSGKTIVPALVNLHGHVGYQRGSTYEATNYTRENILDHLDRYAYYGVGTVVSLGTDAGEIADQIRADQAAGRLGGTLLHHAGRGFALPNAGPGFAALRPAPYGVTSAAEARRDVAELASKKVDVVKIWVDDRNGTVPKLPPEIHEAIIDEAHKHKLKVVAHVYYLADAKALAKAGIDGFAHPVRDGDGRRAHRPAEGEERVRDGEPRARRAPNPTRQAGVAGRPVHSRISGRGLVGSSRRSAREAAGGGRRARRLRPTATWNNPSAGSRKRAFACSSAATPVCRITSWAIPSTVSSAHGGRWHVAG